MKIVALHGFAGQGSDWSSLFEQLGLTSQDCMAPDLFAKNSPLAPAANLEEWLNRIEQFLQQQLPFGQAHKPWLMGYSMGGRLALHLAWRQPQNYSGVVVLAGHPGLVLAEEKKQRLKWSADWAERFERESWDSVWESWNEQEIFSSSEPLQPNEQCLDRGHLAQALKVGSSAQHLFARKNLADLPVPIYWVAGSQDEKYTSLYLSEVGSSLPGQFLPVPNGGHRLLQSSELACTLSQIF